MAQNLDLRSTCEPFTLARYAIAALPSAALVGAGTLVWVTNAKTIRGGWTNIAGAPAISNGISWQSLAEGLPLSTDDYYKIHSTTTAVTLLPNNRVFLYTNTNVGMLTVTLPSATIAGVDMGSFLIRNSGRSSVMVSAPNNQTINGNTSLAIVTQTAARLASDRTNWMTV